MEKQIFDDEIIVNWKRIEYALDTYDKNLLTHSPRIQTWNDLFAQLQNWADPIRDRLALGYYHNYGWVWVFDKPTKKRFGSTIPERLPGTMIQIRRIKYETEIEWAIGEGRTPLTMARFIDQIVFMCTHGEFISEEASPLTFSLQDWASRFIKTSRVKQWAKGLWAGSAIAGGIVFFLIIGMANKNSDAAPFSDISAHLSNLTQKDWEILGKTQFSSGMPVFPFLNTAFKNYWTNVNTDTRAQCTVVPITPTRQNLACNFGLVTLSWWWIHHGAHWTLIPATAATKAQMNNPAATLTMLATKP